MAIGATAVTVDEPAQVDGRCSTSADVLCADTFDGDFVAEQVRGDAAAARRAVDRRAAAPVAALPGRDPRESITCSAARDFESPPRAWEVLMVARRLARDAGAAAARRVPRLGLHRARARRARRPPIATPRSRGSSEFVGALQVPKRVAEMFGELGHELLMNAMYDAPVDASGRPKYAGDRKADVRLVGQRASDRPARDRRHEARPASPRSVRTARAPPRVRRPRARARRRRDGPVARRRRAGHDGVSQRVVGDVLRRRARPSHRGHRAVRARHEPARAPHAGQVAALLERT